MSYLHIDNLYKNQEILIFKKCYALEKIHGTSAHIKWSNELLAFFSGGEKHERFVGLFDKWKLNEVFRLIGAQEVIVYGEAYGGKQQGMSLTYGPELKFIVFDVKIADKWLNVPRAKEIAYQLGLEFVDYCEIDASIENLDKCRDAISTQATRNGMGNRIREGIVLRPIIELIKNNGDRIISKHKNDAFKETTTKREVTPERLAVLTESNAVADEWVTEMRLTHILQKFPEEEIIINNVPKVISSMLEDVLREAKGEIIETREVKQAISKKCAIMFKDRLKNKLYKHN